MLYRNLDRRRLEYSVIRAAGRSVYSGRCRCPSGGLATVRRRYCPADRATFGHRRSTFIDVTVTNAFCCTVAFSPKRNGLPIQKNIFVQ